MGIVPDTTQEIEDQILGQDNYRTRRTIFLVRYFIRFMRLRSCYNHLAFTNTPLFRPLEHI